MAEHIDFDSSELCLIDSGISSLNDIPLRLHLQVLNLHSNYINKIENLLHLKHLKHLDLSANQIRIIEGLDGLLSLRTLNLSCNLLTHIEGLSALRSLVKLNLSYNQIEDLSGIKSLAGPSYNLTNLDLHGNKLGSVAHVSQCLCRVNSLKHLTLSLDGSGNPLCHKPGYESELLSSLPQLQYIDGVDRLGNSAREMDSLSNIPGIEDYIDYLLSNGTDSDPVKDSNTADIITPKIDKALEMYRSRQLPTASSDTSVIPSVTDTELSPGSSRVKSKSKKTADGKLKIDQDIRLEVLEKQIADLLSKAQKGAVVTSSSTAVEESSSGSTIGPKVTRHKAERDTHKTDGSDSDVDPRASGAAGSKKTRKTRLPSYRRSTASSRARKDGQGSKLSVTDDKRPTSPVVRDTASAYIDSDERIRNDIQSSYTSIMEELEKERERRWKAEQAAKKLVDHIQTLTGKAKEDSEMKDIAIDATTRLKQAVTNEREVKLRLKEENEQLKEQLQEAVSHLSKSKDREEELTKSLREMEEMAAKAEKEKLQQQTHEHKKLQDAMMKAAALGREADMLRSTVENQKGQIHSLQSLLATREQEHREELKSRYSLGSKEMQVAIHEEVKRVEKEHTVQLKVQQEKVDELSKQYTSLEDEFREALQIESSRFQQLKEAFETVSEENASNKAALLTAQQKDEKSSDMITELTALVKEQKGRIAELSKSKQEQTAQYRERVQTLEAHVEEARKRMVQLEILKQDNIKLKSQVHGQESVIEGLRAERKLWGQELAQQGASLAQDRGSLEAKIGAQEKEISLLKKQLERETDGVKIKTKMLEDQTETIRKLKEGVEERDEEIKKCRQDNLKLQRNLEDQLSEERTNNQDMQETLERLRERKQDLKHQVSDLQAELDESKKAHSVLNSKWKEKSQLIGQLEQQVREMKESWEKKEVKLAQERDKALDAANLAIDRLKSADDAFRKQLEDKIQTFQEQINQMEHDKQVEIDQANLRVYQVEEEMREMLKENQAAKKAMEDKVKRLTRAMSELESDLY